MSKLVINPRQRETGGLALLHCAGCCRTQPHRYSHREPMTWQPRSEPALAVIYACVDCGELRQWGCEDVR